MDKLLAILSDIRSDIDFEKEKQLVDDCILDSFDIVSIISEISEQFEVDINVDDILPENFNSAEAMYALIERLQQEQ